MGDALGNLLLRFKGVIGYIAARFFEPAEVKNPAKEGGAGDAYSEGLPPSMFIDPAVPSLTFGAFGTIDLHGSLADPADCRVHVMVTSPPLGF